MLLVTIDTLRVDRVGAYGNRTGLTPTIDRLAAEGLRFDAVRAHAPLTLPSHASLMTGRIPPHHGVRDNGTYRLDATHPDAGGRAQDRRVSRPPRSSARSCSTRASGSLVDSIFTMTNMASGRPGRVEVVERPRERGDDARDRLDSCRAPAHGSRGSTSTIRTSPMRPPNPSPRTYATAPYDGEVAYVDAALGRMLDESAEPPVNSIARSSSSRRITEKALATTASARTACLRTTRPCAFRSSCGAEIAFGLACSPSSAGLIDVAPTVLDLLGVSWTAADGQVAARACDRRSAGREPSGISADYFEALNANLTRNWAPLTGIVAGLVEAHRSSGAGAVRPRGRPGRNAESVCAAAG